MMSRPFPKLNLMQSWQRRCSYFISSPFSVSCFGLRWFSVLGVLGVYFRLAFLLITFLKKYISDESLDQDLNDFHCKDSI